MAQWEFRQLAGERKVMTLDGYAAPFGRPRQDPIFSEKIKVNVLTTVYPGSKAPPDRHVFGSNWEPIQLKGRWMTRHLPNNASAASYADDWTSFVRDEQPVRVSWGNFVSYEGFIEELELSRESEDEIAWQMTVLVDRRDDDIEHFEIRDPASIRNPAAYIQAFVDKYENRLQAFSGSISFNLSKNRPQAVSGSISFNLFEKLQFLMGNIKKFTSLINDAVDLLSEIEKQSFSTIQSFRGIITNFQSAVMSMRTVLLNARLDTSVVIRQMDADFQWYGMQLDFDVDSLFILAITADIERELELRSKSESSKFITARDKESWEQLATRAGLGPEGAAVLREANGIRYCERPDAGTTYLVP